MTRFSPSVQLIRLNVDAIVATDTPTTMAAKKATTTVPIVMTAADLVDTPLVASFAKPGGNVTGIAVPLLDIRAKQIQTVLLRAGRLEKATRIRVVTRGLRLGLSLTSR